jgi:hypothetical protein
VVSVFESGFVTSVHFVVSFFSPLKKRIKKNGQDVEYLRLEPSATADGTER